MKINIEYSVFLITCPGKALSREERMKENEARCKWKAGNNERRSCHHFGRADSEAGGYRSNKVNYVQLYEMYR